VATFCHNIAHGLPIQINNPDHSLTLVYIDDLVDEFLLALKGEAHRGDDGFCFVPRTFSITVGALAERVHAIADSRKTAILPDLGDLLTKFLYTTYLSYLETDNFSYYADMKTDNRGWLAELIKSPHMGQIFVSTTKPGITRGGHYHHTKVEKFVVIQGQAVIRFRKIDGDQIIEYPVTGAKIEVVDIPPGYTHDITNVGDSDVITLFWACEIFESDRPDTYFLKV
jgi:UDP-2-acetamido-2,6-beta-L-arabino-hexul-4-ose reductase